MLQCDVVKDTGKEKYLRPFIRIGLDWIGSLLGDAENARHEIAGHENAATCCRGGKCET